MMRRMMRMGMGVLRFKIKIKLRLTTYESRRTIVYVWANEYFLLGILPMRHIVHVYPYYKRPNHKT